MPGYPCCCASGSGGLWDLYQPFFMPMYLDMSSTVEGNDIFFNFAHGDPEGIPYFRSFDNNRDNIPQVTNVTDLADLKTNPWAISILSTAGGVDELNLRRRFPSFHDDAESILYTSYYTAAPVPRFFNCRNSSIETTCFIHAKTNVGSLLYETPWISDADFELHQDVFSTRETFGLQVDAMSEYIETTDGFFDRTSLDIYVDAQPNTRRIFEFNASGLHAKQGPLVYSRSFTEYTLPSDPTVLERFYDIYGTEDHYVGSSASYDTGTNRYELLQPFYTGVCNYVRHSIDYPDLFDPSVTGYKEEYSGLPATGTWVALYGYFTFDPGFHDGQTGIYSTGTLDYYVNHIQNKLPAQPKMVQPLVATFNLDESVLDDVRRTGTEDLPAEEDRLLWKIDLVFKPDEIRQFSIDFNYERYNFMDPPPAYQPGLPTIYLIADLDDTLYCFRSDGRPDIGIPDGTLVDDNMMDYTVDANGFYHASIYINSTWGTLATNLIVDRWPDMTGYPYCARETGLFPQQCRNLYDDFLATFNSVSGYSDYQPYDERTIHITPCKTFTAVTSLGGNEIPTYIGSAGDGCYISGVKISLYNPNYSLEAVKTNVQNKTYVNNQEESFFDYKNSFSESIRNKDYNGFYNAEGADGRLFKHWLFKVMSYDENTVSILNTYPEWSVAGDITRIIETKTRNDYYIVSDGTPLAFGVPIDEHYVFQPSLVTYNLGTNSWSNNNVHDVNHDLCHYQDVVDMLDSTETSARRKPAVYGGFYTSPDIFVNPVRDPRLLVINPHSNCYPQTFDVGDTYEDVRNHTSGISFDFYASASFSIETINKFHRSGSGLIAFSGNGDVDPDLIDHIDSYSGTDYAVPVLETYMGTTTIHRPTSGLYSYSGDYTHSFSGSPIGSGVRFDQNDTIRVSGFDTTPPFAVFNPGGSGDYTDYIIPSFLDLFIMDFSPADLGFSQHVIHPTGNITSGFGPSTAWLGPSIAGGIATGTKFDSDDWFEKHQIISDPKAKVKYSTYGDNYAIMWAENIYPQTSIDIEETGILYSFKYNGNYLFQNISGVDFNEIDFQVGPNHLVYISQGATSGSKYEPYVPKNSNERKIWLDFERVDNDSDTSDSIWPPILRDKPLKTYDLITINSSGSTVFSTGISSPMIPAIVGVTKNHFYLRGFPLKSLVPLSDYDLLYPDFGPQVYFTDSPESFIETPVYLVDSGSVLLDYTEPQGLSTEWRLSYDGQYASRSIEYDPAADNIPGDRNINVPPVEIRRAQGSFVREWWPQQDSFFQETLITNNDQIQGSPLANEKLSDYKLLDYSIPSHVWESGVYYGKGAYVLDLDILSSGGWQLSSDATHAGSGSMSLTGTSSGSFYDVFMYKNLPVEVGKTYILQLYYDQVKRYLDQSGNFHEFDYYITHSGVDGAVGGEVEYRNLYVPTEDGFTEQIQGMDTDESSIFQIDYLRFVYTVSAIDNTGNLPLVIRFNSAGNSSGILWDSNEDPDIIHDLWGMTLHEIINGYTLQDLLLNTGLPTIKSYNLDSS